MDPNLERLLRPALRSFAPYEPGTSAQEVRRRFGIEHPVKLSQNENPLGTSPRALEAIRTLDGLSDYGEDDHTALRERLARPYGLEARQVVCGHGSNELIALAFGTFVDPGDEIVMATPTFSLYRKDAQIAAARAIEVPLRDGAHDLQAMLAAVGPRTKLVFVCDPNNPTGTRLERAAFDAFADALPPEVLLVCDQAYREYAGADGVDAVEILRRRPATLVLRTASKILGLASVRFGYGYAHERVASWMNGARVPFNVSRPAAQAVLAALDDADFIARSVHNNERGKRQLDEAFARLRLHAYPTAANFVAVQMPVPAHEAYETLLARGIVVRSGAGLGMPDRLRVTVGLPEGNAAFIAALEELVPVWRSRSASASVA